MVMLPNDLREDNFVQDPGEATLGVTDTLAGWAHSFFGSHWEFEDVMENLEEYVSLHYGRPTTASCSDDIYAHLMPIQANEVWRSVILRQGVECASFVQKYQGHYLRS